MYSKYICILDVQSPYRTRYINLGPVVEQEDKIWTLEVNKEKRETPVVLLHGFGSGIGLWCMNVDKISNNRRPVYAIDLLGFGRSSRPAFSTDPEQIEQQYVNTIEKWRSEINLEKFVLLGHSFGGYLATAYSLQHPERYISNIYTTNIIFLWSLNFLTDFEYIWCTGFKYVISKFFSINSTFLRLE